MPETLPANQIRQRWWGSAISYLILIEYNADSAVGVVNCRIPCWSMLDRARFVGRETMRVDEKQVPLDDLRGVNKSCCNAHQFE
jgi:hypothetical protein